MPHTYDPESGQAWTRRRDLYLVHDMLAQWTTLRAKLITAAYPNGRPLSGPCATPGDAELFRSAACAPVRRRPPPPLARLLAEQPAPGPGAGRAHRRGPPAGPRPTWPSSRVRLPRAPYSWPVNEMPRDHRPAKSIRVLLAEDQGMMRGALALLLGMEPDIKVVAQVSAGDTIVDAALTHRPDVALLDIELPGLSGLDAAAELRDQVPDCRVLILTTFGRPGYLRRAMEAGAAGFLVKDGPVEDLAVAIRRVLTGETVVDPALAAAALSAGPNPLTARERDVLGASTEGATVADIAAKLHLSESTVRNYLSSAIGKTGTRNRMEALREARQQGWL